jgi:uncharacterized membrane protein
MPLILGGLIPALLYGITGIFQKLSARDGGSAAMYLICFGAATTLTGVLFHFLQPEGIGSSRSMGWALVAGLTFAAGAGLISVALIKYQAAISPLSPLYNMNVLITVVTGLWLLAEWCGAETLALKGQSSTS